MPESRTSPFADFPSQLVDVVIDHLWDDRKALAACSLACRSWLQKSYYHLFEKFSVSFQKSTLFIALGRTNFLSHVRMMMIIGDLGMAEMPRALSVIRANSAPPTLILDSVNLTTDIPKMMNTIFPTSAIHTLRLAECPINESTALLDVLSALPSLHRLLMHHVKLTPLRPAHRIALPVPPRLSVFEIASNNVAPYLGPLALLASQLKLHTLNFGVLLPDDAPKAKDVVAAFPSLQDFTATVAFLPKGWVMSGFSSSLISDLFTTFSSFAFSRPAFPYQASVVTPHNPTSRSHPLAHIHNRSLMESSIHPYGIGYL
jgi:hypothetical protein